MPFIFEGEGIPPNSSDRNTCRIGGTAAADGLIKDLLSEATLVRHDGKTSLDEEE